MSVSHILFDFDGTLADSFEVVLRQVNIQAVNYGLKTVPEHEFSQLKDLDSREILRRFDIGSFRLPFVARAVKRGLKQHVPNMSCFHGIPEALAELHERYVLAILSSNATANIELFLDQNAIAQYFQSVQPSSSFLGKHKAIRRYCKSKKIDPAQVFYIGDESRDIEAARLAGVKTVAVAWGYSTKACLERARPDCVVTSPKQLRDACDQLISGK